MKTKLFLFSLLLIMGTFFATITMAEIRPAGPNCEDLINYALRHGEGENFNGVAIFTTTDSAGTDDDENPDEGDMVTNCVLAKETTGAIIKYVTFEELRRDAVVSPDWDKVQAEIYNGTYWEKVGEEQDSIDERYYFQSDSTKRKRYVFKKSEQYENLYMYYMEQYSYDKESFKVTYLCEDFNGDENNCKTIEPTQCFWFEVKKECWNKYDIKKDCSILPLELCGTEIGSKACQPVDDNCVTKTATTAPAVLPSGPTYEVPAGYVERGGVIPACAFTEKGCQDINDLLQLIVNFGKFMFGGIAVLAFIFFIYGGFVFVTSFGNAEKVKKGRDILVAAILGLVVAFAAYLIIYIMLDFLGVKESFRGLK